MRKKEFNGKWIQDRVGALPSGWDSRSLQYVAAPPSTDDIDELPEIYTDLLEYCPTNTVFDQGNVGTCVGWDYSGVVEVQATLMAMSMTGLRSKGHIDSWMREAWKTLSDFERAIFTFVRTDLSAGWVYHWSRIHSFPPVPDHVEGSTNFGACKALHKEGIALEMNVHTDRVAPWDGIEYTDKAEQEALQYKIASYHRIDPSPTSIKAAIYGLSHVMPYKMLDGSPGKTPVPSAFPVYANFKEAYDDGIVPMPEGQLLGGHSSMIYGWDTIDDGKYFENYGSWGKDVGDNGVFHIPIEYPFYPNDWWLVKLAEALEPPKPTCIYDDPNWVTGLLNWIDRSGEQYYRGREVR